MKAADIRACLLCIDGLMPAGTDAVFGQIYRQCPSCIGTCALCEGAGCYPAEMRCFEFLVDALDALGYEVDLCRGCCGITDLSYRSDGAP